MTLKKIVTAYDLAKRLAYMFKLDTCAKSIAFDENMPEVTIYTYDGQIYNVQVTKIK